MRPEHRARGLRAEIGDALRVLEADLAAQRAPRAAVVAQALSLVGDALRASLPVARTLIDGLRKVPRETLEAAVAEAASRASELAAKPHEPSSSALERDVLQSFVVGLSRVALARAESFGAAQSYIALERDLRRFDVDFARHWSRDVVQQALRARLALHDGESWLEALHDAAEASSESIGQAQRFEALSTPPSAEDITRYIARGALSTYIEGTAKRDSSFRAELCEHIAALVALGEEVGLSARRFLKEHGASSTDEPSTGVARLAAASLKHEPKRGVGETYLLLFDEGAQRGRIARLRALDRAVPATQPVLLEELERARAGLSTVASRALRLLPETVAPRAIEILDVALGEHVSGDSLGVAACAAWLSRALGIAAAHDVAATAEVSLDGSLLPVDHLEAKLAALQDEHPEVTRVVVAAAQPVVHAAAVTVVPCANLRDALGVFGLEIARLPSLDREAVERAVDELKRVEQRLLGAAELREEAAKAIGLREACRAVAPHRADECVRAAALFWLHAGERRLAEEIVRELAASDAAEEPELFLAQKIALAAVTIDSNAERAISVAQEAVELASHLSSRAGRVLHAQALGTQGRALMRSGAFAEAEACLRRAVQGHEGSDPREVPRSLVYLAQCLRLQARFVDALAACEQALDRLRDSLQTYERKTSAFVQLERGRALLALSRMDEASRAFELVVSQQARDDDYPRIAGLRGLALTRRSVGDRHGASILVDRCAAVAATTAPPLRDVALRAVHEAPSNERAEVEARYASLRGTAPSGPDID